MMARYGHRYVRNQWISLQRKWISPFRFNAVVNKVASEVGSAATVALSKLALTAATPTWTCVWGPRWAAAEALGFSQEFPRRRFAA